MKFLPLVLVACAACGRTSLPGDASITTVTDNGDTGPAVNVMSFTLTGVITATKTTPTGTLKLGGATGSGFPPAIVVPPMTLSFSGTPPASSYTLDFAATDLGSYIGYVFLEVFADTNDNGFIDIGEQFYGPTGATTSTPLFCDGTSCGAAAIDYLPYGASGSGAKGSFQLTGGWYATAGCSGGDLSCAAPITESTIAGVDLQF